VFVSCEQPRWYAPQALLSRGFNGAMRVRNALWRPAFIMYYLRFTLPEVLGLLQRHGFRCAVEPLVAPALPPHLRLVVATRTG
jgi:hypothetical protein